ncbi:MAG: efflux RND transporter periplasmic adaptor subunit [Bacteroidota bacterium]
MRILLLLFITFIFFSCGSEQTDSTPEIRRVKYATIEQLSGQETHTFSGSVVAKNEVALSFKVSGTLTEVNVALGDLVKKGQLIAVIDPTDYTIQANQAVAQKEGAVANEQSAEANVKSAETQLINAQATYDRIARLYENNSVSLNEYQGAKASLDAAKAQYDSSLSQLKSASTQVTTANQQLQSSNNQVGYTRVYAPMDGVVTDVLMDANEMVGAGTVIAIVSSVDQMLVEVGVPEIFISRLKKGQEAVIQLPSLPGQQFAAEIVEVAFASGNTPVYPVKLKIVNPVAEIRPGMATAVDFEIDNLQEVAENLLTAPIKAVGSTTDGNYVFRLIPEEEDEVYKAEMVPVQLGDITNTGYIIQAGLAKGDFVAVAGLTSLYDGKIVKLLEK